jgi:catechol-2,3-dioxygenase
VTVGRTPEGRNRALHTARALRRPSCLSCPRPGSNAGLLWRESPDPTTRNNPGLNHLAFGVGTPTALRELVQHLNSTGLRHSGIKVDHYGNKEFVWLDDPNGFRLEFYCRPTSPTS